MAKKKEDNKIQYGSERHIATIQRAYGILEPIARKVVKEFEAGEKDWDVDYYQKCKAMLAVIDQPEPVAVSPRKGWKRDRSY